jgi:hypothetical protein
MGTVREFNGEMETPKETSKKKPHAMHGRDGAQKEMGPMTNA